MPRSQSATTPPVNANGTPVKTSRPSLTLANMPYNRAEPIGKCSNVNAYTPGQPCVGRLLSLSVQRHDKRVQHSD